jgi:hypothetical protein
MNMNLTEFTRLCDDASMKLGLVDPTALGCGVPVSLDDVVFETTFAEGQSSFLLLADLGAIAPHDKADVYEQLLTLQLTAWDEPNLLFGFHPLHEAAVLCVRATLEAETDGAWLAELLQSIALQVTQWRQTLLAGKVSQRRNGKAPTEAVMENDAFTPSF